MATFKEALEYAANNPDSEFAKSFGKEVATGNHDEEAKKLGIDTTPIKQHFGVPEQKQEGVNGLEGFAVGVGKGILSTIKGVGQLGEKIGGAILPESLTPESVYSEESLQKNKEQGGVAGTLLNKENLKAQGTAESIGKGAEQIAEFAVPATKVSKATQGANLLTKIGSRAATSAGVASAQSGEIGKEALIAGGVETALPIAGKIIKPATKIIGRLFKGLGSGLSGVGTDTIEQIVANPKVAQSTVKELTKGGNAGILKKNAETIVNGVANIKKEARTAYGTGLEVLKSTDIKPKEFRKGVQSIFDDYGSVTKGNTRELLNVEFKEANNLKKASSIFDKLSNTKLDGKSLKSIMDSVEKSKYPSPKTEEAMAFNSFVNDVTNRLKTTISKSTDKLDEINKAYSKDIGLAQSIEQIFGKVKFKNTSEVNKVAQKLETLFSQKGLSPEYVDDFLNRIGIKPEEFKTSEAVRQISGKTTGANTKGLSIGEVMQQVTSSVITPKIIRDVAIATGKSEKVMKVLLENVAPSMRATLIESLIPTKD